MVIIWGAMLPNLTDAHHMTEADVPIDVWREEMEVLLQVLEAHPFWGQQFREQVVLDAFFSSVDSRPIDR